MRTKEDQTRIDLKEWLGKTEEKIPELIADLTKRIEEIVGGSVQLQFDDQRLA
jgi:hypothetical protein